MLISTSEDDTSFDDKDICLICYDKLDENVSILKCNHKYHYKCIQMTYKNTKKRNCPYCRSDGGFLELPKGTIPLYGIHKEYINYKKNNYDIVLIENKCKYILVKGKNKGCQCSFNSKTEEGYCMRHHNMLNNS